MADAPNTQTPFDPSTLNGPATRQKRDVPDGLWMRCDGCEEMLYTKLVTGNLDVCPKCGHHFRIGAHRRIELLTDADSFEQRFDGVQPHDPLEFQWADRRYQDYLSSYQERAGTSEAVLTGIAYIKGRRLALGVMNNQFIMGSMGSVVGERLTRLIETATAEALPLVIVCTSGGARMHEGALSLMQMAKTSAALARFDDAGGLYIAVLTDPTTGGTTASFVMLGDFILAEPGALIGFAGQRVIANTIREELPEGFQTAEFLLEHGFIDRIVPRSELRSEIAQIIDYCG
ncbi:MAG: acetyl-CoA carboxylase carboxyltransferase subunit beta [Phycisphaerae bacterium]|nr:acetyl-CoA carboxylase carboxyltransferase subunit beta [Phycisphaerae bacterium]